jgi:hypothetical protein
MGIENAPEREILPEMRRILARRGFNPEGEMKSFRSYKITTDDAGMPTKLTWLGDIPIPAEKSQAEKDAEKLAEWEKTYGKREVERG